MSYHAFSYEDETPHGSFETFQVTPASFNGRLRVGWYWWACFPGCLPDGEPNGPFATEEEAIEDARAA